MLLTLGLVVVVVGLIYLYLVWNFNYWKKRGVPGPKPIPLVGNYPSAFFQKRHLVYEVNDVYKLYRGQSPFIGYFAGRAPALMAIDPGFVKDILTTNFKNFHDNEFNNALDKETDPILSRNPEMLSGEEWKQKRQEITPAFTSSKIKSMFPITTDVCHKMTAYLKRRLAANPDGIDVKDLGANFTTDVVASCIYGIDSKAFSDEKSVIRQMGASLFDYPLKVIVYYTLLQAFPFMSKFYQMKVIPERIESFFTKLMNDAIKLRVDSKIERDDYLNYMIQLSKKKNLKHVELAAHTVTFFLDGYETSSNVISHVLYQVARHLAVQIRLRQEIQESIAEHNGVTYESMNGMTYLDQVFQETLRMNPAFGHIARKCTEAIEVTGYKDKKVLIEKDKIIMIPVWSIHHDPEYYADPETFDPERFSEANGGLKKYKDNGVFLAWGDGPRTCLGMRFGIMQVKTAIIELINNFELSVNGKTHEPYVNDPTNFNLMPTGGLWLNFKAI